MDTNLLVVLQALANAKTENTSGTSTAQIIGMVLVALPSIIAAIASAGAWLKANATEKSNAKTAEQVVKIHEAVNSERTATLAKVESMHQEIRGLSGANRALEERSAPRGAPTPTTEESALLSINEQLRLIRSEQLTRASDHHGKPDYTYASKA